MNFVRTHFNSLLAGKCDAQAIDEREMKSGTHTNQGTAANNHVVERLAADEVLARDLRLAERIVRQDDVSFVIIPSRTVKAKAVREIDELRLENFGHV